MARRNNLNVPEVTVNEEGGTPPFPKPPDNSASRVPGPGKIKCICVTKCYRDGLVKPGDVRYFTEVPEHFKSAEQVAAAEQAAE